MRRICYILLATLSLSTPICALTFIVPSGTTETSTLDLPNPGDRAVIEEGGSVEVANDAVTMSDDNQTVFNQGRISTTGNNSNGIFNLDADNVVITNSGLISTAGITSRGIFNNGDNVVITNSGLISTIGGESRGIFNNGDNVVITNSGLISTTMGNAQGILNNGGANAVITNSGLILTTLGSSSQGILSSIGVNAVITNSGLISTIGANSPGIILTNSGANAVITNSGLISTIGGNSHGIDNSATGDGVVITNSGLISTTGVAANGIIIKGGSNDGHIINSGTIRSIQLFALDLQGTNQTLSLLRGSNLQGPVTKATDDDLNLNVETGLNLALTLDSGDFGNLGIEAPFALVGDTIVVIDPTGLALQADVLADLSDTILNGIFRYRAAFPCSCIPCGRGVWIQGIGSYRTRSYNKDTVGYDNGQGGFLIGYDTNLCGGNAGLFGGVSFGEAEVDEQTQRADITSYVGGLTYERLFCNTFLGLAVAIGYVDWENERFVMNNLAEGGVETAKFDTGGIFVSPEATMAHSFASLLCTPTMSFTLRYTGLFLGDYREKGSLANLSVKNREIDLLTTRFEVALPYSKAHETYCWSIEPYLGVFGRYQLGGNHVNAELLGQSLSFDPRSPHNLVAFLLGFREIQSFGCFNLFLNLEGSFDNYSSSRILGEGGIGFSF